MTERYTATAFYSYRRAQGPAYDQDRGRLYYVSDASGTPQLWRTGLDGFHEQVTFFEGYVSSPVCFGSQVYLQVDYRGSEEFKIFKVDSEGGVSPVLDSPRTIFRLGDVSDTGLVSYSSNARDNRFFDSYVFDSGVHRRVYSCDGTSQAHGFNAKANQLLITQSVTNLNTRLLLADLRRPDRVLELIPHVEEALVTHPAFDGSNRVVALTNYGSEFLQPTLIEPSSGSHVFLDDAKWDADVLAVSPSGAVAFTRNEDGYSKLCLHIIGTGRTKTLEVFEGTVSELLWSPDSTKLFATASCYDTSPNIHLYEVERGDRRQVTDASRGYLGSVAKPELGRYKSFDGLEVPFYLYLPASPPPKGGYPVVVYVHGGPESQKRIEYDGQIQYLVKMGYAVVTPNVRGSSGYGKEYVHLDDIGKRLDSVRDLAELAQWIKSDHRFDGSRICVMGRSYGGYMVLASLCFYPEIWRCGVESVGISDLESFLRRTSAWRRALREAEYGSLERDLDVLRKASPIHYVDRMRAPLLVQHGSNDPRVPYAESEAIVNALQARGVEAELVTFEDEGHMNQSVGNRVEWGLRVAEFLSKHL